MKSIFILTLILTLIQQVFQNHHHTKQRKKKVDLDLTKLDKKHEEDKKQELDEPLFPFFSFFDMDNDSHFNNIMKNSLDMFKQIAKGVLDQNPMLMSEEDNNNNNNKNINKSVLNKQQQVVSGTGGFLKGKGYEKTTQRLYDEQGNLKQTIVTESFQKPILKRQNAKQWDMFEKDEHQQQLQQQQQKKQEMIEQQYKEQQEMIDKTREVMNKAIADTREGIDSLKASQKEVEANLDNKENGYSYRQYFNYLLLGIFLTIFILFIRKREMARLQLARWSKKY